MVIYNHDYNAILTKPLKPKVEVEHLEAIQKVHQCLNSQGMHTRTHIIDIEHSTLVNEHIKHEKN